MSEVNLLDENHGHFKFNRLSVTKFNENKLKSIKSHKPKHWKETIFYFMAFNRAKIKILKEGNA